MNHEIGIRKKEHIELCLTDDVSFKKRTNGFENYEFVHYALTDIDPASILLESYFFNQKIAYPFLISCMTGGTDDTNNINLKLAKVSQKLNIPLGLGSQRYALESTKYDNILKEIRAIAFSIPLIGNIGFAQLVDKSNISKIVRLIELINLNAFVVHLNPLQELIQPEGETNFHGSLESLAVLVKEAKVPIIVKEVGSGISPKVAELLLKLGVSGIDVSGAGGTSWAGVEILRRKTKAGSTTEPTSLRDDFNKFWDWGLPTSYCIKMVSKLKKTYHFTLIGSGGINTSFDFAKSLALGSDISASARKVLQTYFSHGEDGVVNLIENWMNDLRMIMYLTGSSTLHDFNKSKLINKRKLF